MLSVLMVGHACDPRRGSEHSSTWNWAWHVSRDVRVTLLTHAGNRSAVEEHLRLHPNPNLQLEWVGVRPVLDPWRPERSDRGIHLHYLLWQFAAYKRAAELLRDGRFDLIHHVGWGSLSAPPKLWNLRRPFIWGPVGGGQTTPPGFLRYFGPGKALEALRNFRVRMMPYTASLREAARNSSLVLATNNETAHALRRAGARTVTPFLDSGVAPETMLSSMDERERRPERGEITLLWAGLFERRKALPLALEAMAARRDIPARLLVAGDGPMRSNWEKTTKRLGLSNRVEFLGWLPRQEMQRLYRTADAFIFTSLRDSFASVNLEAMAQGLPIITLDHQGVGAFVPEGAGIKAPVDSPEQCIRGLSDALATAYSSPEKRREWGRNGLEFARTQTWPVRAERMRGWYEDLGGCGSRPPLAMGGREPLQVVLL